MMCSYRDCLNVSRPCSSIAYFALPNDQRRNLWIENSGNDSLREVKPHCKRVICEKHFLEKDLRRQFNRTILRRDAVPVAHETPVKLPIRNRDDKTQYRQVTIKKKESEDSILYYEILEVEHNVDEILSDNNHQTDPNILNNANTPNQELESDDDIDSLTDTINLDSELISNKCTNEYHLDDAENVEKIKKPRLKLEEDVNQTIVQVRPPPIFTPSPTKATAASVAEIIASGTTQITLPDANDSSNDDTYFVLSLIGTFKRLPPQKRAIAKCNILRYLTELEYGTSAIL